MKNPGSEQLFLEEWTEDTVDGKLNTEHEALEIPSSSHSLEDEECKVCGDSGPCSACERGRLLAREQGKPYRRTKK